MFNLDLQYLRLILIPIRLRKQKFLLFMRVIFTPLNYVQTLFNQFFNNIKNDLSFTGQVIYLEHLLNDKFDNSLRRIYIDEASNIEELFVFQSNESDELTHIYQYNENPAEHYLFSNMEIESDNDFTIVLPIGLSFDINYLTAIVNRYKTASVRYNILEL